MAAGLPVGDEREGAGSRLCAAGAGRANVGRVVLDLAAGAKVEDGESDTEARSPTE